MKLFIRLSRGSGLTGLSGMKSKSKLNNNIFLFRPLLDIKKQFLIKITKKKFGHFFKDPSNKDTKYLRTKVRNLKKSLLKSGINYDQITKSINNLASSKATLEGYYEEISKDTVKKTRDKIFIDFKKFALLNSDLKMQVINKSIKILKKIIITHDQKK